MQTKLVFVDWDGAIVERVGTLPLTDPATVRLVRDVIPALRRFIAAGYDCVTVANRPDSSAAAGSDAFVAGLLASQGVRLREMLVCRHGNAERCSCRKPGVGLAVPYLPTLDHGASIVVGDEEIDLELARNLGVAGFRLDGTTGWSDIAHAVLDRPRQARVLRKTRETEVEVSVDLDRGADAAAATGIGFFDHMLQQLGKHGGFALTVRCRGDLEVDEHHTIEDVALALGQALRQALGDKRGIQRYGFVVPMDEASAQAQVDLGGRAYLVFDAAFPREQVGGMPTELVEHFFRSLADSLSAAIHVRATGVNTHHMIEACFKAVARALRMAIAREGSELPTTKGQL